MTDYNKGDIVEPTLEFRTQVQEALDRDDTLAGDGDRRIAAGETLRVIGLADTPYPGLYFVLAAPMDRDITDLEADEFAVDSNNPKYDDLVLLLEDEIQHVNGVLAGV